MIGSLLQGHAGGDATAFLDCPDARWYATVQQDMLGCVLPQGDDFRAVLLGWDGQGAYMTLCASDGHESIGVAHLWLTKQRRKLLPPLE